MCLKLLQNTHAQFSHSADNGLRWQRVMSDSDTLQTPSLLYPWEQHRRLCTRSTISDYPSQTNLTAHRSPAPSIGSALCLDPKREPKAQDNTTIHCPVLPDHCLAAGPRADPSVCITMSFYSAFERDSFTHRCWAKDFMQPIFLD